VTQTGASLVPAVPALALVALACAGGLIATRGVARRAVGVLLAVAGLGMAALLVAAAVRPDVSAGWAIAALAGAVVLIGAAGVAVRQADRWPTMGGRYGRAAPHAASGAGANAPEPAQSDRSAQSGAQSDRPTESDRPAVSDRPTERDGRAHSDSEAALWDALDRGEDPTR